MQTGEIAQHPLHAFIGANQRHAIKMTSKRGLRCKIDVASKALIKLNVVQSESR